MIRFVCLVVASAIAMRIHASTNNALGLRRTPD